MSISKRLPDRQEMVLVFIGCVFIIHVWAIVNLFYTVPAWLLRMNMGQLVGSSAYVLSFALMESILVWGFLLLLTLMLPNALLRKQFVAQSIGLVLVSAFFSIVLHFNYAFLVTRRIFIPILVACFIALALVVLYWTGRSERFDRAIRATLERLSVLSGIYLFFDAIAVLIVLARNIIG
jgi:hypothetical protein